MKAEIVITERRGVRLHTFVSPAESWSVTSQILEGPHQLVVFDAQLLTSYAEELADYIVSLGKPVERIVISHAHPDHWAGLGVLVARLPGVPTYALAGVVATIRAHGATMRANLGRVFGDALGAGLVVPETALAPGLTTIDGVIHDFREVVDAEADLQLIALLPEQKMLLAFDLVFDERSHLFAFSPNYAHWIDILNALPRDIETVLSGHDAVLGPSAIDATRRYLATAADVYRQASSAEEYVLRLSTAFPERRFVERVSLSSFFLFARSNATV